jgi:hypothetical protein
LSSITVHGDDQIYRIRKAEITKFEINPDTMPDLTIKMPQLLTCRGYPGIHLHCIEVENDIDQDMKILMSRLSGQPDTAGMEAFLRMLYFSVVTITTLGFGDIVPLTRLARSLVTLEAFLGPLLLGFFLSAIGLRLSPSKSSHFSEDSNIYM